MGSAPGLSLGCVILMAGKPARLFDGLLLSLLLPKITTSATSLGEIAMGQYYKFVNVDKKELYDFSAFSEILLLHLQRYLHP